MTPIELKKFLMSQGLEVYRTVGSCVHLAERVRENLLMDSGVSADCETGLAVRFVTRAQGSDFPAEGQESLLERARLQGEGAVPRGYDVVDRAVVPIRDPGAPQRTLDTWFEVTFARTVADQNELLPEIRFVLGLAKVVSPGSRG